MTAMTGRASRGCRWVATVFMRVEDVNGTYMGSGLRAL